MNEWASPWETSPPTPIESLEQKPPQSNPDFPSTTPIYSFFDTFTNEASWGTGTEDTHTGKYAAGHGLQDHGNTQVTQDPSLAGWHSPMAKAATGVNGGRDEKSTLFETRSLSNEFEHETAEEKTVHGLLDLEDDGYLGNGLQNITPSSSTVKQTRNDLLDLMNDDFLGSSFEPVKDDAEVLKELQWQQNVKSAEHTADGAERFDILHASESNEEMGPGETLDTILQHKNEQLGLHKPSAPWEIPILDVSQDHTVAPDMENSNAISDLAPIKTDEAPSLATAPFTSGAAAERAVLQLDERISSETNITVDHEYDLSVTSGLPNTSSDIVEVSSSGDEIMSNTEGNPAQSNNTSKGVVHASKHDDYIIEVDESKVLNDADLWQSHHESTGDSQADQTVELTSQSNTGSTTSQNPEATEITETNSIIVDHGRSMFDNVAGASSEPAEPQQVEESSPLGLSTPEVQRDKLLKFESAGDARPIEENTAYGTSDFDLMFADKVPPEGNSSTFEKSKADSSEEGTMSYIPDKSLLPELFPHLRELNDVPIEPKDEQIESTSVRKTWYRISRQASMRYYDSSDFDNYVRVTWSGSAIQAKVTDIVAKWVMTDRQTGGSLFKSSFQSKPASGKWPEELRTDEKQEEKASLGMRISLPKPPTSPAGFGWSTAKSPGSINAIPGPPTPNGWLTPPVSTPPQNLQVPGPVRLSTPAAMTPSQTAIPNNIQGDDDEFGLFVSSASPIEEVPIEEHTGKDFEDWFDETPVPRVTDSSSSTNLKSSQNNGQVLYTIDNNNLQHQSTTQISPDVSVLSPQPLAPLQPISLPIDHHVSLPAISTSITDGPVRSSRVMQKFEPRLGNNVQTTLVEDSIADNSVILPDHDMFESIAAPQTTRLSTMPNWFSAPLVPSKPQTPVSATRSISSAQPSFMAEDWFDAPSASESPIPDRPSKISVNQADPTLKSNNLFNTTTIFPNWHSLTNVAPPLSASYTSQNNNDQWFGDDFVVARPEFSIPPIQAPPQAPSSHWSSPIQPEPFLPPPPRSHSVLSHHSISSSQPRVSSVVATSSPLAPHSDVWAPAEEAKGGEENAEDEFDDDFGGFVTSPPQITVLSAIGTALCDDDKDDSGWGDIREVKAGDTPFEAVIHSPTSTVTLASNPFLNAATSSPLATIAASPNTLDLAFDTAFFDTLSLPQSKVASSPSPNSYPPIEQQIQHMTPNSELKQRVVSSSPVKMLSSVEKPSSTELPWLETVDGDDDGVPDLDSSIDTDFVKQVVQRLPDWSWIL